MWFYDFVKFTGIPIVLYTRLKRIFVTANGEIKRQRGMLNGKYLVAANHTSFFDPVVLVNAFWERRLVFVAMEELFQMKLGKVFKLMGCIPVNRENVSLDTFKRVENQLYRGHTVAVFPEGGLETDNEIKTFKSGIALMAVMSGADIIPTYIVKRTSKWHSQVILIGEKIKLSDYVSSEFPSMEELNNLTKVLQEREYQLENVYKKIQERRNKK